MVAGWQGPGLVFRVGPAPAPAPDSGRIPDTDHLSPRLVLGPGWEEERTGSVSMSRY